MSVDVQLSQVTVFSVHRRTGVNIQKLGTVALPVALLRPACVLADLLVTAADEVDRWAAMA